MKLEECTIICSQVDSISNVLWAEVNSVFGYYTMQSGGISPTFQRNLLPPYSE